MNREILFRGKHILTKDWIFGDLVYHNIKEDKVFITLFIKSFIDKYGIHAKVEKDTVGQLLFIINGHRFFEGDIIGRDNSDTKYVILWNEENQCFSTFNCYDLKNINEGDELLKLNTLCNMEQVRLGFLKKYNFYPVGNIFDNPEMMEAAN
jgi:hypothetical protein